MARESGLSHTTIWRIWGAFGLQPHRSETFKLSSDPHFVDKVRDIVGLYLSPPDRALVLCVDEKSQIQALDRTQPVLPMLPGMPERRTHDYKRNGTTSLFAALNVATGSVIGKCYKRHRATEFLDFLKEIDRRVPDELDIHIVMDNYANTAWHRKRRADTASCNEEAAGETDAALASCHAGRAALRLAPRHHRHDLVLHGPDRRLLDPETAAEFHRRDAVLRRHDQVDGGEPECQRQLGRVDPRTTPRTGPC